VRELPLPPQHPPAQEERMMARPHRIARKTRAHQAKAAARRWEGTTPEERSAWMSRLGRISAEARGGDVPRDVCSRGGKAHSREHLAEIGRAGGKARWRHK
jgi:acyl-CoA reductase-like NAD-dependent aldehyde dehydrogenase